MRGWNEYVAKKYDQHQKELINQLVAENKKLKERVRVLEAQLESANESYREELLEHDPFKYDALYGDDDKDGAEGE